jgi:hypothetical protein
MNHRIEKLSSLLDLNETQLNEISNGREYGINETRKNPCSPEIRVNSLLIQKSKRFKDYSSIKKHKGETCKKRFPTQSHLNIHKIIHSKEKTIRLWSMSNGFFLTSLI